MIPDSLLYGGGFIGSILVLKWLLTPEPKPVKGKYRLKGKYFQIKYYLFYLLLRLRRWRKASSKGEVRSAGFGRSLHENLADMEKAQPLPDPAVHPMAVDAVYFNGFNKEGYYLVTGTARRQNNQIQMVFYLRIPGFGLLQGEIHPETLVEASDLMSFAAAGLQIKPIEPMIRWAIDFDGQMRHVETDKLVGVKFHLDWIQTGPYFDFDAHMSASALAEAVSRELWSREFFESLQLRHQTHHEQFGCTSGRLEIEGRDPEQITLHGIRDHSYGNIRAWRDLQRYQLSYLYLDDSTSIAVGVVSSPLIMSRLPMGYVVDTSGVIQPVESTDFEMYHFGDDVTLEQGEPPDKVEFNFKAAGKLYNVKLNVLEKPYFIMRDGDMEISGAKIFEMMVKCTVNNIEGVGISEWCYGFQR